MDIASMIDHTLLKADATEDMIKKLCYEAIENGFAAVCVNPYYVSMAKKLLKGSKVSVDTVIGFPLGSNTKEIKVFEAKEAVKNGADEIDMVINIGALRDKKYEIVRKDIEGVVKESGDNIIIKTIIETGLLTDEEKIIACKIARDAKVDFVKTATGFGRGGATIEDIRLMNSIIGQDIKIKASGGIRDYRTAKAMIDAGASRIGTSASVSIIKNK